MKRTILLAAMIAAGPAVAAPDRTPSAAAYKVERVVLLMRHGVRPPTKAPAMPDGVAAQPWPAWPVPAGWLTPHGAAAIRLIAASDRAAFVAEGLIPATGCGAVRLVADSDQRTIATAEVYRDALAPGCAPAIEHRPQGDPDPLFTASGPTDEAAAREAVIAAAGPGGLAGAEARARPALALVDRVLCGGATGHCGVSGQPTALAFNAEGRAKLSGALDRGSTAAQVLLLEHAEGKPAAEVGWGHADAAAVTRLSSLHALEFALTARPLPLARRNMARLAPLIHDALLAERGPTVTVIVGHDTNVASLAGLIDAHWTVPGFATDDPSPGGALMLERVVDRRGDRFVRVAYRSQTLAQIRSLTPLNQAARPFRSSLAVGRCAPPVDRSGLCPAAAMSALLGPASAP